jgi:hypothetical protein
MSYRMWYRHLYLYLVYPYIYEIGLSLWSSAGSPNSLFITRSMHVEGRDALHNVVAHAHAVLLLRLRLRVDAEEATIVGWLRQ